MKLTVIGNWGGYPAADGATAGYLLQQDGYNLLIDCGSAVVSTVQNYLNIEDLNSVIISHYHHDHVADIGILQYACLIKSKLNQFSGTLNIYGHPYDEDGFKKLTLDPYTKGIVYNEDEELNIGPLRINFCRTTHPVICYAMRITAGDKTIVYTADGSYSEAIVDFSRDADLLICECNFYSNQSSSSAGHMNSTDAAGTAEKAKVKKLFLTHLPQYGDLNELVRDAEKTYKGKIELAKTGLTIEI